MKKKIAINGFGRIGRAAFKIILDKFENEMEVVAINDLTDNKTLAHLLKYDSVYRQYNHEISSDEEGIIVDSKHYKVLAEKDPANLPWKKLEVDVVIESTGRFRTREDAGKHITAGAKKVVLSAPGKGDDIAAYVLSVNDKDMKADDDIVSNASCTTNSIAPVVDIINKEFGIAKAILNTIHSYTADQNLVDGPHKDLRRARAAACNMIPTTTGAAKATTNAIPELKGLFGGLSVRVPTPVVSLSDITMVLKKDVTAEEINNVLIAASKEPRYKGILQTTDEPLVSSDLIGNPHSSIVDLSLTDVVGGNLVKVIAWYDNEWGYSNRLVEMVAMM
ncbi:MAG: type I glyceraldehyde-3-phosphate dehydrogenase [bacterium]